MKLTYVCLATVVVTMCNTSTAVNGALHGLRSFASLEKQKEKSLATLELQDRYSIKERHLSQTSQHDIFITEGEAMAQQRRKIKKKKKTIRKKNRKPWQEDKDRGKKKRKKWRKSKSQSRKACSNQDRIVCDAKGKKVLICRHKDGGIVKTVCMKGKKVPYHLKSHSDDYCGRCTDDDLDLPIPSSSSSNTEKSTTTFSSIQSYSESKSKKSEVTTVTTSTTSTVIIDEETTTTSSTASSKSSSGSGGKGKSSKSEVQADVVCRWKGMPPEVNTNYVPQCDQDDTKIAICHYKGESHKYEDLCVESSDVPKYLDSQPEDFCGPCDQLSWEEKTAEFDYISAVMDTSFNDLAQFLKDDGKAIDELTRFTTAVRNEIPPGMRDAITDADIIRPLLKRNSAAVPSSGRSLVEISDESGRSLVEWSGACKSKMIQFVTKIIGVIAALVSLFFPVNIPDIPEVAGDIAVKLTDTLFNGLTFKGGAGKIVWFAFTEVFHGGVSTWGLTKFVTYFDAIIKFLGNFQMTLVVKYIGDTFKPWDWIMISFDLIVTLTAAWVTVGASLAIKTVQLLTKILNTADLAAQFIDFGVFLLNWEEVEDVCKDDLAPRDSEVFCSDRLNVGTCEHLIIIMNSHMEHASNPCHAHPKGMELVHHYDGSNEQYHCEGYERCCWKPTEVNPLPRCMVELKGIDDGVNGIDIVETDPELGVQVSGAVGYCTNRDSCFKDYQEEIPVFIADTSLSSVIISPGIQSGNKKDFCTGCCLREMECSKEHEDGYIQKGNCIRLHDPNFSCPYDTSLDPCGVLYPPHRCCLSIEQYPRLDIIPPQVKRFQVGVSYTFKFDAFSIKRSDPFVDFAWSFTGDVNDMTSDCCQSAIDYGRASYSVDHTFTTAGTYTLLVRVRSETTLEMLAQQTIEMSVSAEDCPPTIPPTKCAIFYTNGEYDEGECLTESACNGEGEDSTYLSDPLCQDKFGSECGNVGCCLPPPADCPSTGEVCTSDSVDDDRVGECHKAADCSGEDGKELTVSSDCGGFVSGCDIVNCCVRANIDSDWKHMQTLRPEIDFDSPGFNEGPSSVAMFEDTLIVGLSKHRRHGVAFVYEYSQEEDNWMPDLEGNLELYFHEIGHYYGIAVALHKGSDGKKRALIGASEEFAIAQDILTAYVWRRDESGWVLEDELHMDPPDPGRGFGYAVALYKDVALVGGRGASAYDTHVYLRNGNKWILQTQKLRYGGFHSIALYGRGGSADEFTALIETEVYVGVISGESQLEWTHEDSLFPDDDPGEFYGSGVSLYGDTALIGARRYVNNDGESTGAAFAFIRGADNKWLFKGKLIPTFGEAGDEFGYANSLYGDTAIIAGRFSLGPSYIFTTDDVSSWEENHVDRVRLNVDNGWSVALANDVAIIGGYQGDPDSDHFSVFKKENFQTGT